MGKSTPSTPKAPDPSQVIGQQTQSNIQTAIGNAWMNNTNQVTPYGNLTYNQIASRDVGGGYSVPQFEARTELTPAGQKLQDTQMAINQGTADLARSYVDRIGAATSQPFNYDGISQAQYDPAFRQHTYETILARAQPQLDRDQAALRQRLADQGIGLGDAGYETAMRQYNQGLNDFRLGADLQSQQQAASDYNVQAANRARQIQEAAAMRSQPINEVAALLGTGSGVQAPQFVNTPQTQIQPTDTMAPYMAQYQAEMQQQQQAMSRNNAMTGGLFGLGGAAITAAAML